MYNCKNWKEILQNRIAWHRVSGPRLKLVKKCKHEYIWHVNTPNTYHNKMNKQQHKMWRKSWEIVGKEKMNTAYISSCYQQLLKRWQNPPNNKVTNDDYCLTDKHIFKNLEIFLHKFPLKSFILDLHSQAEQIMSIFSLSLSFNANEYKCN